MIRIYFAPNPPRAGREVVPLAQACGVGRDGSGEVLFARKFEELFGAAPGLWRAEGELARADVAVYAHNYEKGEEADGLALAARAAGKPALFFNLTDHHTPCDPPHGVVYRSAILKSRMTARERAMPAVMEDILIFRGGRLEVRPRAGRPSVGFCGYISPAWKQWVRTLKGDGDKVAGHVLRRRAVAAVSRCRGVEARFLVRRNYWGGALVAGKDPAAVNRIREEYAGNIIDTDYTLCVRGAGNFSIRFYETLAAGRVPLLIDTDCALPLADRVRWEEHCVIVPEREMKRAGEILARFHAGLAPGRFEAMQRANRKLWEEELTQLSFLRRAVGEAVGGPLGRSERPGAAG